MSSNQTVAQIILNQLGGNIFMMMTGAKDLVTSENSLQMRLPNRRINKVVISLNNDLYHVQFYKLSGLKVTLVAEMENVYANQLQTVFSVKTGLDTHL